MPNPSSPKPQGPDPAVVEAINRLKRVELSPLEEQLFNGWMTANGIEEQAGPESPIDFRDIYQKTGGKVLPPGQMLNQTQKQSAIDTLMKAQEAHDKNSPMRAFQEGGLSGMNHSEPMGSIGGGDSLGGGSVDNGSGF